MVDLYKKPKNMAIGMYYGKDYMGRRRNYNYYGYGNKYRGYNYYGMLQNYRKGNQYEVQQGEKQQKGGKEAEEKQQEEETSPPSDPPKEPSGSDKAEGKKRKADKEMQKGDTGSGDKKKEASRKKCIIKILKRPTEAVSKEEGKGKSPMGGEKASMEEGTDSKEQQKKKKKEKVKEIEREGAKDSIEQKSKKKKDGECATSKGKKVKDGFKFTSTQELFNLLLKDVKNNFLDEEVDDEKDEEDESEEKKKKLTMAKSSAMTKTNGDSAKGPSEGTKMESENENAKKITKRSIPNLDKQGERSTSGVKGTQSGRNDEEERNSYEGEQRKSIKIKAKEGNNTDVPKGDTMMEAEEKCPSGTNRSNATQTTKATGASGNVKESVITLKGKKGGIITSGSNKYNNQINIGSNISRGRKIKKIMKNVENGKYYYNGSRKDLGAGGDVFEGGAGYYVKYATSKYPNFTTNCSFLNHASKMELCKNNSLNSRLMNSLNGTMGTGQRNDDIRKAGKKEEEEGFFAVPIYMRSPKPEQIPIPVYLSGGVDQVETQEAAQERVPDVLSAPVDVKEIIEIPPEAPNEQGRKSQSRGQSQNAKGVEVTVTPNGHAHNKDNQNALNFTKKNVEKKKKNKTFLNKNYMPFNQEQNHLNNHVGNHANKYAYDFVSTGNLKNNKVYSMHPFHPSYVKATNYNGCNLYGSGKNLKMEKYFHNKRYKVKAYLSDNNQRSKNLNTLKEVKIAVY